MQIQHFCAFLLSGRNLLLLCISTVFLLCVGDVFAEDLSSFLSPPHFSPFVKIAPPSEEYSRPHYLCPHVLRCIV